jgi:hypothetical protein
LVGVAAVAALASLGFAGVARLRSPAPPVASAACSGECEGSNPLVGRSGSVTYSPGSHLISTDAPLGVTFGALARMQLEPKSELVYRQAQGTRRFQLLYGSVRVQVEKLAKDQRFIVETPNAEVEVRGTAFEVALLSTPACEQSTRVRVSEGTVQVRGNGALQLVRAGESHEVGCAEREPSPASAPLPAPAPAPTPAPASAPIPSPVARVSRSLPASHTAPEAPASAAAAPTASAGAREGAPASKLAVQNDLYARALAARNSGNPELALALHAQILARFPSGPLAESAMIERIRLLASRDRGRAAQEAHLYLRRFPSGFAREEAEAVARP